MACEIPFSLVLCFVGILMGACALTGFGVWRIARQSKAADNMILEKLGDAYGAVKDMALNANNTTADAAGVMGDAVTRLNAVIQTLSEVAMTTHAGAAMERAHNKLLAAVTGAAFCGTQKGDEESNADDLPSQPQYYTGPEAVVSADMRRMGREEEE